MTLDLTKLQKFIKTHKVFLLLIVFFFAFRLFNLTKLPVNNDESIYLHWGYEEIHTPGKLFFSLFDSKQPLLMWIFGASETLFADPVWAGRFISILSGFLTLVGLYKLTKKLVGEPAAYITVFLYTIIPILSFFDRQALMESAIASIGIWSLYFLIELMEYPTRNRAFLLGAILGLGFFIKSSALLFLITSIVLPFALFRKKNGVSLAIVVMRLLQMLFAFCAVDLLLFMQPLFWQTFNTNDRYTFTLSEILQFPFAAWMQNLRAFFEIGFFFVSPLIFLAGMFGIIIFIRSKKTEQQITVWWFLLTVFLQIILVKSSSQRYLVSYLPLFAFFASAFFISIYKQAKQRTIVLGFSAGLIALLITLEQLLLPEAYFFSFAKLTSYSMTGYATGFTAGYGLDEVYRSLDAVAMYHPLIVGVAANTGNPEDAIFIHYQKSPNVQVVYLDGRFIQGLDQIDCFASSKVVYFVSRGEYLTSLNKFLDKATEVHLPYTPGSYIGVWTLKNPCVGRTLMLNFSQTQ